MPKKTTKKAKKKATKKKPKGIETRGRKPLINPELHKSFVSMCESYDIQDVRDALGVKRSSYESWIRLGKAGKQPFAQFYYDMKAAKAKRRMRNLRTIQQAGDSDWRAAAWLLSRLERERYGDHVKTENIHDVKNIKFSDLWNMTKKDEGE